MAWAILSLVVRGVVFFFSRRSDLQVSGWKCQGISKAAFCKCLENLCRGFAVLCVRRNEHGREGCLSVFLGRDLASVRRGNDVLLIFQQDSSRGLFGWTERQSVQRWVHLLQTKNDACICIYISRMSTFWDPFYCKRLLNCWLTLFSTTPCELWSETSQCTTAHMHIHWHTHTRARAHVCCFGANSRPPHTPGKVVLD